MKRRRVFRVLIGYGLISFAVLQIIEPIMHALHLPDAVLTFSVIALALGFPVALVLAWAFDVKAGGIERTPASAGAPGLRGPRLALLVAIGAVAAAPGLAWYFLRARPAAETLGPIASATADGGVKAAAPETVASRQSIAVLAFADLSPAKDREYLSDGIAEEILNALTRVSGLKVAGRTSSFHYKGRNEDLRSIGSALGVANLLEGSVRTQGERVKISAQLIRAEDGFHLWSETYDGVLTDVFELEERISRAIVRELAVVLRGGASARLVPVATASGEAYALYLRATDIVNRRQQLRYEEAGGLLDEALRIDPRFARAEARLATLYSLREAGMVKPKEAEAHARRAIEMDPKLAEPHGALSRASLQQRRFVEAREESDRALALEPDDAWVNFADAQLLIESGYTRLGRERLERTLVIDPLLPNALFWRSLQYLSVRDFRAAKAVMLRAEEVGLSWTKIGLIKIAAEAGDVEEAKRLIRESDPFSSGCGEVHESDVPIEVRAVPIDAKPSSAARAAALAVLERCIASRPQVLPSWVPLSLMRLGKPERALALVLPAPTTNDAMFWVTLWGPGGQSSRTLPGFGAFAAQIGLAALWDRSGPPDACDRVSLSKYICPR